MCCNSKSFYQFSCHSISHLWNNENDNLLIKYLEIQVQNCCKIQTITLVRLLKILNSEHLVEYFISKYFMLICLQLIFFGYTGYTCFMSLLINNIFLLFSVFYNSCYWKCVIEKCKSCRIEAWQWLCQKTFKSLSTNLEIIICKVKVAFPLN